MIISINRKKAVKIALLWTLEIVWHPTGFSLVLPGRMYKANPARMGKRSALRPVCNAHLQFYIEGPEDIHVNPTRRAKTLDDVWGYPNFN